MVDKGFINGLLLLVGAGCAGAGFLLGSQVQPREIDSQLAEAQVVAQDRDVRWIGYTCGDDGATIISREMPNISECQTVQRLREDTEFPTPPLS